MREREKVVGEKVVTLTKEVPCPITGQLKLQTIEVIEKVIETEVRSNCDWHSTKFSIKIAQEFKIHSKLSTS